MLRYLALGDSYTIGTGVESDQSLPAQLARALHARGLTVSTTLIAQNGWTTGELAARVEVDYSERVFDLVSLLVGVNNQYRGGSRKVYKTEFRTLLEQAVGFAGDRPARVLVLSIPDWSITPFAVGDARSPGQISAEISAFNTINHAEALNAGTAYVDIFTVSREKSDPAAFAEDGLHPSPQTYTRWVEHLLPTVLEMLALPS